MSDQWPANFVLNMAFRPQGLLQTTYHSSFAAEYTYTIIYVHVHAASDDIDDSVLTKDDDSALSEYRVDFYS